MRGFAGTPSDGRRLMLPGRGPCLKRLKSVIIVRKNSMKVKQDAVPCSAVWRREYFFHSFALTEPAFLTRCVVNGTVFVVNGRIACS